MYNKSAREIPKCVYRASFCYCGRALDYIYTLYVHGANNNGKQSCDDRLCTGKYRSVSSKVPARIFSFFRRRYATPSLPRTPRRSRGRDVQILYIYKVKTEVNLCIKRDLRSRRDFCIYFVDARDSASIDGPPRDHTINCTLENDESS